MRALLCRTLGEIANLQVAETADPKCGPGMVRIAVKASGVNFPDILMTEGRYQVKPDLPFIPGLEVAGDVIECGAGVDHLHIGARVLAFARFGGGHAEQIVLPAEIVTPIPPSMDYVTAAAFFVAYGTAHFALAHRGGLQAGETVLVLGAAGGVGLAAIEVAKMLGARVIAAAGSEQKLALARAHGADQTINYRSDNLRDQVLALTDQNGVDVVFDPVGGDAFSQSVRCIGWQGRILVVGFASGDIPKVATNMILVKNFSVVGVVFGEHSFRYPSDSRQRMMALLAAYDAAKLTPEVMQTFPLDDAQEALGMLGSRQVMGKLVLTP
ncbi:NADPH:quinone oxidoreductase family protein [Alphaproteobacteria bacterium]|nr:NADPH:quinone oxidoreductase family protein [Alphaproteobacteria bacterium]